MGVFRSTIKCMFRVAPVFALLSAQAESVWVVPDTFERLDVYNEGSVEINRASVQTIRPGSMNALTCPGGSPPCISASIGC